MQLHDLSKHLIGMKNKVEKLTKEYDDCKNKVSLPSPSNNKSNMANKANTKKRKLQELKITSNNQLMEIKHKSLFIKKSKRILDDVHRFQSMK